MTHSPDTSQTELAAYDAPSGTPAIETHGLSKHFGQRKAVDGLSVPMGPARQPPFACCWGWCDQARAAPGFLVTH